MSAREGWPERLFDWVVGVFCNDRPQHSRAHNTALLIRGRTQTTEEWARRARRDREIELRVLMCRPGCRQRAASAIARLQPD